MRGVIRYALWATLCAAVAGAALSLVHTWFFSYHVGRAGFWSTLLEDFATTLVIAAGAGGRAPAGGGGAGRLGGGARRPPAPGPARRRGRVFVCSFASV